MMGIYKFTNRINGKCYIGQSSSIETRYNSHKNCCVNKNYNGYETKFYRALRKYGFENFNFEVLEEANTRERLNELEAFYIEKYDSFKNGYNSSCGGDVIAGGILENHSMAKLTNEDILEIKKLLKKGSLLQKEIATKYKTTQSNISQINLGKRWREIGNYSYPIKNGKRLPKSGETNGASILSNEEVLEIRRRYKNETGRKIFVDYEDKISYVSFERALTGRTYKNLPIYKKKENVWLEPVSTIPS